MSLTSLHVNKNSSSNTTNSASNQNNKLPEYSKLIRNSFVSSLNQQNIIKHTNSSELNDFNQNEPKSRLHRVKSSFSTEQKQELSSTLSLASPNKSTKNSSLTPKTASNSSSRSNSTTTTTATLKTTTISSQTLSKSSFRYGNYYLNCSAMNINETGCNKMKQFKLAKTSNNKSQPTNLNCLVLDPANRLMNINNLSSNAINIIPSKQTHTFSERFSIFKLKSNSSINTSPRCESGSYKKSTCFNTSKSSHGLTNSEVRNRLYMIKHHYDEFSLAAGLSPSSPSLAGIFRSSNAHVRRKMGFACDYTSSSLSDYEKENQNNGDEDEDDLFVYDGCQKNNFLGLSSPATKNHYNSNGDINNSTNINYSNTSNNNNNSNLVNKTNKRNNSSKSNKFLIQRNNSDCGASTGGSGSSRSMKQKNYLTTNTPLKYFVSKNMSLLVSRKINYIF